MPSQHSKKQPRGRSSFQQGEEIRRCQVLRKLARQGFRQSASGRLKTVCVDGTEAALEKFSRMSHTELICFYISGPWDSWQPYKDSKRTQLLVWRLNNLSFVICKAVTSVNCGKSAAGGYLVSTINPVCCSAAYTGAHQQTKGSEHITSGHLQYRLPGLYK